jgi:hypothetical protein
VTGVQDKSISKGDTGVAATPVGTPSKDVAETSLEVADVTEDAVALTT